MIGGDGGSGSGRGLQEGRKRGGGLGRGKRGKEEGDEIYTGKHTTETPTVMRDGGGV